MQAAHRSAGQLAWSAPQNLSADGSAGSSAVDTAEHVHVAAGPEGGATVAWIELTTGLADVVQVARRLPGAAAFGPAQTLSDPSANSGAANLGLAVDVRGDAVATWDIAPADIVIEGPEIPTVRAGARAPRAAAGAQRAAAVPRRVQGAFAAVGAPSFGAAFDVSDPARYADLPHLAANPKGGFVLEYDIEPQMLTELTTRGPGPDSTFGPPRTIATVYDPQLAVGPDGDATIAWARDHVPWVDSTDATAPTPDLLSIPERGFAGRPLTFSVAPHDRLSPLAETSWSFGDGTSASGDAVTHTFAEPGVRRVTVTVADVLGNGASVTRAITVVPVPVQPGREEPGGGSGRARRPAPRIAKASLSPRRGATGAPGRAAGRQTEREERRAAALQRERGGHRHVDGRARPPRPARRPRAPLLGPRPQRQTLHGRENGRHGENARQSGRRHAAAERPREAAAALPRGAYRLQLRLTDAAGTAARS